MRREFLPIALGFLDWASGLAYLAGAGISGFLLGKLMGGMEW
jgi:hypothetical protein